MILDRGGGMGRYMDEFGSIKEELGTGKVTTEEKMAILVNQRDDRRGSKVNPAPDQNL